MPTPFHLVHILYISLMLCRNMIDVCLHKFCEGKLHCIPILLFRFLTLRNSAYCMALVPKIPKSLTRFTTLWGLTWHENCRLERQNRFTSILLQMSRANAQCLANPMSGQWFQVILQFLLKIFHILQGASKNMHCNFFSSKYTFWKFLNNQPYIPNSRRPSRAISWLLLALASSLSKSLMCCHLMALVGL